MSITQKHLILSCFLLAVFQIKQFTITCFKPLHVAIALVVLSATELTYSVILTRASYFYESITQFVLII